LKQGITIQHIIYFASTPIENSTGTEKIRIEIATKDSKQYVRSKYNHTVGIALLNPEITLEQAENIRCVKGIRNQKDIKSIRENGFMARNR
jgi:hypothetical protein